MSGFEIVAGMFVAGVACLGVILSRTPLAETNARDLKLTKPGRKPTETYYEMFRRLSESEANRN